MHRIVFVAPLLAMALASGTALAWDTIYEADVMPTDASLGASLWNLAPACDSSLTGVGSGVLHLRDPWLDRKIYYVRETSMPAGTPMTVETRVRIASGSSNYQYIGPAALGVWNLGGGIDVRLWTNHLAVVGSVIKTSYTTDWTSFHTIRAAVDAQYSYKVWVDGVEVASGQATTGYQGIRFGTPSNVQDTTVDSYWDYVRYSKAYEPPVTVPEPASLLALLAGLGGLFVRRRDR